MGRASTTTPLRDLQTIAERAPVAVCPICGNGPGNERFTLREMLFGTRESFEYSRCRACGVLWLVEPPEDLAPYYPTAYFPASFRTDSRTPRPSRLVAELIEHRLFGSHRFRAGVARRLIRTAAPDVRAIRPLVRAAGMRSLDDPILDVGSSPVPERLLQLAGVGFRNLLGIDPMLPADIVHDGVPVRRLTIHEVEGQFALVMFHHSFEHVRDPRETLLAAARLVRPGGAILIRTPVMGTWFWDTYGTSWWELDPPRHLFVHTRESIGLLAGEAALELEAVEFDSTFLEVVASDQIRRDIPWRDPRSCRDRLDDSDCRPAVEAAKALVRTLNAEGRAGRAAFYLRRPE